MPAPAAGLSLRQSQLAAWFAAHVGETEVSDLSAPVGTGFSNDTVLFTVTFPGRAPRRLVARIGSAGGGLFPDNDISRQRRTMTAVRSHSAVPVPAVLWWHDDPAALGAPFFIMEQVQGRVPSDDPKYTVAGWLADLPGGDQRRLNDAAIATLAAVHAVDWRAAGLGFLTRPGAGSAVRRQIAYLRRYYAWARRGGAGVPSVEAALRWAQSHQPGDGGPAHGLVLNWGDARPENMIFGPDLGVAAVLDWEMASINPPELDLAWWLFALRYCTEGIGVPRPAGLYDVGETVARYADAAGGEPRDLRFFEILATIDAAIICLRIARLYTRSGSLPPDSDADRNNGATHLLCAHLGLPPPGPSASPFRHQPVG
jgi:aminoglycoside phosphotransferase (APT) family kinase protein